MVYFFHVREASGLAWYCLEKVKEWQTWKIKVGKLRWVLRRHVGISIGGRRKGLQSDLSLVITF